MQRLPDSCFAFVGGTGRGLLYRRENGEIDVPKLCECLAIIARDLASQSGWAKTWQIDAVKLRLADAAKTCDIPIPWEFVT